MSSLEKLADACGDLRRAAIRGDPPYLLWR